MIVGQGNEHRKALRDLTTEEEWAEYRFEDFIERGWGHRRDYDGAATVDRIKALRTMVDAHDIFAAVWPERFSPNGYAIAFFKGEAIAGLEGEATGEVRFGCIMTDSADHARGLIDTLHIWRD